MTDAQLSAIKARLARMSDSGTGNRQYEVTAIGYYEDDVRALLAECAQLTEERDKFSTSPRRTCG